MNIVIALVLIILVICIISIIVCHNTINITKYEIKSEKISSDFDGFKIVHLSDLHSRIFRNNNYILISKILEEKPDIIAMTGDMVNGNSKNINDLEKLIKAINSVNGKSISIYYIMGNREFTYNKDNYFNLVKMLEKNNAIVLDNKKEALTLNDSSIFISGINYNNRIAEKYYNLPKSKLMSKETENSISSIGFNLNKEKYNILLVHSPKEFEKYSNMGFDLILAGHIHGGVVRIPVVDKGVLSPNIRFFPKYDKGLYEYNESIMCVNSGIGYGTIPFRIFNRPEIVVIQLNKGK